MICSKCGANIPDDANVCPACGAPKVAETPVQPVANTAYVPKHASPDPAYRSAPLWDSVQTSAPVSEPARPAGSVCPRCGKPVQNGIAFCGGCGYRLTAPVSQAPAAAPAAPVRQPRKTGYSAPAKSTKLWIPIAAGVALFLVVAIVISLFASAGGPMVKIGSAVKKTVNSGNFTADYELEIEGESAEGTIFVDVDVKNREVAMYTYIEVDGVDITWGIYEGTMFMLADYGYTYGYTEDIQDALDEIFDIYEETGTNNTAELLEQINDLMDEYMGEELSDYVDLKVLEKSLKEFVKDASKKKWLEENLGYSRSKEKGEILHTFTPVVYDFLMATLPYFEDCFEDSEIYENLLEELEDVEDYLGDNVEMELTIGVKSGYLSSVEALVEIEGEELEMYLEVYDVNKTRLNADEMEEMIEEAEDNS